ncbi:MAG: hypothetical protein WCT10_05675 [Patescibacteria group bacterium]
MKKILFLLAGLLAASCATTATPPAAAEPAEQWFVYNVPANWVEAAITQETPADVRQPLMSLRNLRTGAEIVGDAINYGDRTIDEVAMQIYIRLNTEDVLCTPISFEGNRANFKLTLYHESGEIWRGKVVVMRLPGAPPNVVFIATSRWPSEYDLQMAAEFDAIISSAAIK